VRLTSRLLNYVKIRKGYKRSCRIYLKTLLENSLSVRSIFSESRSTCVETRHILHSKWHLKSPGLIDKQLIIDKPISNFMKIHSVCSCFSRVHVDEWNEFNSYAVDMLPREKRKELEFDFIPEL
jgi:hypothetical protein